MVRVAPPTASVPPMVGVWLKLSLVELTLLPKVKVPPVEMVGATLLTVTVTLVAAPVAFAEMVN